MKKILWLALLVPTLALAGRDGSGNYSLPAGNPVVTGTTITSSWANGTMADIAAALTASLCRNAGCGGMNTSFYLIDGNAGTPGLSYNLEQNSGWYRAGAGDHRYSILGSDTLKLTAAGAWFGVYRIANWYDIAMFAPGRPAAAQLCARIGFTAATRLLAGLPSAVSFSGTNATSTSDVLIKKRTAAGATSQIGYARFTAASGTATISFLADVDFAAGDFIEFIAPSSQDTTLADITLTIQARRL